MLGRRATGISRSRRKTNSAPAAAGCNVEVRVTPLHAGPASAKTDLPDEGTIDITYKLTGDESGPDTGLLWSTVLIKPLRAMRNYVDSQLRNEGQGQGDRD